MTNEQAGEFIKSAYYFMVNGELPECSFAIEMALTPFVNQWARDAEKWETVREKRIKAGAKGGKQKLANASKSKQKTLVNVNGNVNVNVNDNVNAKDKYPTLEDVKLFFIDNGYSEIVAEKAWNYYNDAKWHDAKGNKVKNWKQKMRGVWFKDENKSTIQRRVLESEKNPDLAQW